MAPSPSYNIRSLASRPESYTGYALLARGGPPTHTNGPQHTILINIPIPSKLQSTLNYERFLTHATYTNILNRDTVAEQILLSNNRMTLEII